MRIFCTSVQEQFFEIAHDHRSTFGIPGGKQIERTHDTRFHWNRLTNGACCDPESDRITDLEFLFCKQAVRDKNPVRVCGELIHQDAKLFGCKVALPICRGREGETVYAEINASYRTRRYCAGKFITPYSCSRFDSGNTQVIFHRTKGIHRVFCMFIESCTQLIKVDIRTDLIMHLFVELRIQCAGE